MENADNRVHGTKPNAYARLRKTGTDEMLSQSGPSSSCFFDNPEKKEIIGISGNSLRFTAVPNPIPFDFAQGKFTDVVPRNKKA